MSCNEYFTILVSFLSVSEPIRLLQQQQPRRALLAIRHGWRLKTFFFRSFHCCCSCCCCCFFLSSSSTSLCWPTLSAHRQFSFRHRFYGRSTADRQMLHSDMEICLKKKQRRRRKERTMKDKRNHDTLTRPVLERKSEREEFPNLVHTCWTRGSLSAPSNCSTRSTTTGCLLNSFSLSVPLRGTRRENERLLFTIFLLDDVIANVTAETGILWGYNTWTWSVGSDWTTGALNSCLHKNTTDGLEKTIESKQTAINY